MKILLNKKNFINALSIGSVFTGKNKVMPILNDVKIKIKPGMLSVVSSDGDNYISRKMTEGVDTDGEITFCVEPFSILSYIKSLDMETIQLDVDKNQVEIIHENGNFTTHIEDSNNFVNKKMESDTLDVNMNATMVRSWFTDGKDFTMVNDNLRPVLNGLYIYKQGNEIGCCATDSYTLFTDYFQDEACDNDFAVIVNSSCFKPIIDAFTNTDNIEMKIGKSSMVLKSADTTIMCALQEGNYPNFKKIISSSYCPIQVCTDKKELIKALNRCTLGANALGYVKITVNDGNIELLSLDEDFNKGVSETLQAETVISETFNIYFKIDKLLKILGKINSDKVMLSMKQNTSPCFIKEWPDPTNAIYMLMPFNVN